MYTKPRDTDLLHALCPEAQPHAAPFYRLPASWVVGRIKQLEAGKWAHGVVFDPDPCCQEAGLAGFTATLLQDAIDEALSLL